IRFQEGSDAAGKIRRKTGAEQIATSKLDEQPVQSHAALDGSRRAAAVEKKRRRMILKVLSDPGERNANGDVMASELLGRADAGQHQELRRVDRARGEDHLAFRPRGAARAVANIIDPDGAGSLHDNARDVRL